MAHRILATVAFCAAVLGGGAQAQGNPFAGGWTLRPDGSSLNFQSTKNQTKVETSGFAAFSGSIDENGAAKIVVELESVDTGIDLRNVRMRFLFFESFQFPTATITAQLDPGALADLRETRRKIIRVPYVMNLHGVVRTAEADLAVTLLTDEMVNVSTATPIIVAVADYDLAGGVQKLEEAAGVEIMPQAAVTFDFNFGRNALAGGGAAQDPAPTEDAATAMARPAKPAESTAPAEPAEPAADAEDGRETVSAALEPEGALSLEACVGRFEILSRTDNIYFRTGSARLDDKSVFLLDTLHDIVSRCPGLIVEVGGHTDNVGSDAANQRLSERRAAAVVTYLTDKGVAPDMLVAKGYGEAEPAFDNATAEGRGRNRRIGFTVLSQ